MTQNYKDIQVKLDWDVKATLKQQMRFSLFLFISSAASYWSVLIRWRRSFITHLCFTASPPGFPASVWIGRASSWPPAAPAPSRSRSISRSNTFWSTTCRTSWPCGSSGPLKVSSFRFLLWQKKRFFLHPVIWTFFNPSKTSGEASCFIGAVHCQRNMKHRLFLGLPFIQATYGSHFSVF